MDSELTKVACEVAKQISKDAYNDTVKPIAEPTSNLLGLVPRAIKAGFAPLEKWILHREYNVKETELLLAKKLKNIDPEKIVSPEPYIAVPALQQISYSMDNEELRDMYANLLSKAMNIDTKDTVHPSFVEIIKQLSPDEALLLKYIYKDKPIHTPEYVIPVITLIYRQENTFVNLIDRFSNFPEKAKCALHPYAKMYFDNLERLGLLEFVNLFLNEDKHYIELREHPYICNYIESSVKYGGYNRANIDFQKMAYRLTAFGVQFCKICVAD